MVQQLLLVEKKQELENTVVGIRKLICSNAHTHKIAVVRYGDGSIWVFCPYFGYLGLGLGCKIRQARCRYYKAI